MIKINCPNVLQFDGRRNHDVLHTRVRKSRHADSHWSLEAIKATQTAIEVGLTLAQRRDDSTNVGLTLGQPTL